MNNFYENFTRSYINELRSGKTTYRSQFRPITRTRHKLINSYERGLNWITGILSNNKISISLLYRNNYVLNNIERFADTYELLSDDYSKTRYIEYVTFKAINSPGLKLSMSGINIDDYLKEIEKCRISMNHIRNFSNIGALYLYDLSQYGYSARVFHNPIGILIDFILEQYAYKDVFNVQKGDVVIDCGGATGDTAIYFSAKGASKVFVFEFIQSNIEMMRKQISANPHLENYIDIINKAVWKTSNAELSYIDRGNASRVAESEVYPNAVATLSIDDMVIENRIERIDLIKMDIEGAELPALEGAEETIRRYKPKLAICVYHKDDDLIRIPEYIMSLNANYQLYFDYYTDVGWEAVLYAVDRSR